jgi:hypothetical protein
VSVRGWHWTPTVWDGAATDLNLGRSRLGFLGGRSGRLGLRGGSLFGAKCFDPCCLETRSFSCKRFLLSHELGRGLRGLRGDGRLLFCGRLDVGRFSPATNGIG